MNDIESEDRLAVVREATQSPLDVLVIGGGIVGAGVARDAAMRGLRVGLVEQHVTVLSAPVHRHGRVVFQQPNRQR